MQRRHAGLVVASALLLTGLFHASLPKAFFDLTSNKHAPAAARDGRSCLAGSAGCRLQKLLARKVGKAERAPRDCAAAAYGEEEAWALAALGLNLQGRHSQAEIKKAYRKLVAQCHPDRKGGSAERFEHVKSAYELLTGSVPASLAAMRSASSARGSSSNHFDASYYRQGRREVYEPGEDGWVPRNEKPPVGLDEIWAQMGYNPYSGQYYAPPEGDVWGDEAWADAANAQAQEPPSKEEASSPQREAAAHRDVYRAAASYKNTEAKHSDAAAPTSAPPAPQPAAEAPAKKAKKKSKSKRPQGHEQRAQWAKKAPQQEEDKSRLMDFPYMLTVASIAFMLVTGPPPKKVCAADCVASGGASSGTDTQLVAPSPPSVANFGTVVPASLEQKDAPQVGKDFATVAATPAVPAPVPATPSPSIFEGQYLRDHSMYDMEYIVAAVAAQDQEATVILSGQEPFSKQELTRMLRETGQPFEALPAMLPEHTDDERLQGIWEKTQHGEQHVANALVAALEEPGTTTGALAPKPSKKYEAVTVVVNEDSFAPLVEALEADKRVELSSKDYRKHSDRAMVQLQRPSTGQSLAVVAASCRRSEFEELNALHAAIKDTEPDALIFDMTASGWDDLNKEFDRSHGGDEGRQLSVTEVLLAEELKHFETTSAAPTSTKSFKYMA
eukprot:TRINITY_DN113853_c0_g1_i1.p1 TRINITY_DN113853_c0_g1~~TRINITY_DN113853_c0_g1_i1.p1  ORF type:complete len:670 (-),score=194.68 TRINITY_DN113853_c0_g1_i1:288-2297(-)